MSISYLDLVKDIQARLRPHFSAQGMQLLDCVFASATLVGLWQFWRLSAGFGSFVKRQYLRPLLQSQNRMYDTYARKDLKSWAVVTGGSDGLGLAICKKLAQQGFNIAIVARNATKIESVLEEIKKEFPSIETRAVIADFAKMA